MIDKDKYITYCGMDVSKFLDSYCIYNVGDEGVCPFMTFPCLALNPHILFKIYVTTSSPIKICNVTSGFTEIIVDGEVLPSVVSAYTFDTMGEHTVECKLQDETKIVDNAFGACSSLTSLTIPDSVTTIGGWAFDDCNVLRRVTIGNNVTSIGPAAFQRCSYLRNITIGNSVTTIGGEAFFNCWSLTTVTIPNSVTSIGENAFYRCSGLISLTVEATSPPTIGNNVFADTNECPIYVPAESVNAYKTASGWSEYADRIYSI